MIIAKYQQKKKIPTLRKGISKKKETNFILICQILNYPPRNIHYHYFCSTGGTTQYNEKNN